MTLTEKAKSNTELNSIIEMLVDEVIKGVSLKTVKKSLTNKNMPVKLVNKITRIVKIESQQMGV